MQRGLAALGFDAGLADGMFGPRTRSAIRAWQRAKGLAATGYLTRDQAEALAAAAGEIRQRPSAEQWANPTESRNQVPRFAPAGPKCAELKGRLAKDEQTHCWWKTIDEPGCYI